MNTINAIHRVLRFQLKMGRSPRIIPPLMPEALTPGCPQEDINVAHVIERLLNNTEIAKDNLLQSKVAQATYANKSCKSDFDIKVGDRIMLSTLHHRCDYKNGDKNQVAKFMPRFDGPYIVTRMNADLSSYTLDILNSPGLSSTRFIFPELCAFIPNDSSLFP